MTYKKVVTNIVDFVTIDNFHETMYKKFVSSHHTKVSTFAIRAIANHNPKIAKELAFFLSHFDPFVQLDANKSLLLTPCKNLAGGLCNLTLLTKVKLFSGLTRTARKCPPNPALNRYGQYI